MNCGCGICTGRRFSLPCMQLDLRSYRVADQREHLYNRCVLTILLANSPAGLRGPAAPEKSSFVAAFCQLRWQKAATKNRSLEGFALQTSQSGVSQQND